MARSKRPAAHPGQGLLSEPPPAVTGSVPGASGSVRVIDRTMVILKCLSEHGEGITLTELSREVGLHKATVLRFLKTLERGGFAAPAASGKGWRIGPALLDIRTRLIGRQDVREVSRPVMEDVARSTGETVQLAMLADEGIVYVEKVEPPDLALRINTRVGTRRPIHCTALGKLLGAYGEPADITQRIRAAGMTRYTAQTITSLSALEEELALIREQGYAIDDREFNELVVCVAAPILDADGCVTTGLSISTFGISVKSARFRELTRQVADSADRISRALGWRPEAALNTPATART